MSRKGQRMCWSCSNNYERNYERCLEVLQFLVLAEVEMRS